MDIKKRARALNPQSFVDIYNFIVDFNNHLLSLGTTADDATPKILQQLAELNTSIQNTLREIFSPLTHFSGPLTYAATTLISCIDNNKQLKSARRKITINYSAKLNIDQDADAYELDDIGAPLLQAEAPEQIRPQTAIAKIATVNEQLQPLLDKATTLKDGNDEIEQNHGKTLICLAVALQCAIDSIKNLDELKIDIETLQNKSKEQINPSFAHYRPGFWQRKCCCSHSLDNPQQEMFDVIDSVATSILKNNHLLPVKHCCIL